LLKQAVIHLCCLEEVDSNKITRAESLVVGLAAGILCPLLLFTLGWWGSAALAVYQVLRIPESVIAIVAFTGLAAGVTLDVIYLKRWISRFYNADARVVALVYLCCSVMAVATFMGLPVGNLVLGTLAGAYIGRREYHAARRGQAISMTIKQTSIFTALVTGAEALPIGLLALNEDWVTEWLQAVTGIDSWSPTSLLGMGLVVLLCLVLMAVQFWCTKTTAWIAFTLDRRDAI
jgi:hypothetical protein